jgi:hypothetical protein
VNPLEKPTGISTETSEAADEAAIFLTETHDLLSGSHFAVQEAVTRVQQLDRAGRLVGITALPGYVTLHYTPEVLVPLSDPSF